MGTFSVELGSVPRTYAVHVAQGSLDKLGEIAARSGIEAGKAALVADAKVAAIYADRVVGSLSASGFDATRIEVPPGEPSKSLATVSALYERFIEAGLDRQSAVFALGGGVIGDLAGFAAATYMRGVPLVQVPTTLLAQVDSCLGGKTGVNHPRAKNVIGAFYQPHLVVADVATLTTLAEREYREGLAEVIKYAATLDGAMVELLEGSADAIARRDGPLLEEIVERSLKLKAFVVERDERERGLRRLLNFGHTIGHALEAALGLGTLLHGEAVAIGMAAAAKLSRLHAGLSESDEARLLGLIRSAGLPAQLPQGWRSSQFVAALNLDKKRARNEVEFVLIPELGRAFTRRLTLEQIMAPLETG